jgi:flagella basal body P-ring formation protein FlgA
VAGVQRIVLSAELRQLARKFHVEEEGLPSSACFEQATEPLTASMLVPALQAAFTTAPFTAKEVSIEIIEFTNTSVPRGKLQFTRGGLEPSGLWHGRMVYGPGRSVNVWAKVRVTEERTWVEAAELLPAGRIIRADQLVLQTGIRSPLDPAPAESLEDVVGKKALRTLAPGVAIRTQLLIEPPQVERGDKVEVQVESGDAHLQFEAEAESPGHIGDLVFLRNPENGHRFQARVEGKGKVAIRK